MIPAFPRHPRSRFNTSLLRGRAIRHACETAGVFLPMYTFVLAEEVRDAFEKRFENTSTEQIRPRDLVAFLEEHFFEAGNELEECVPSDWVEKPKPLMRIQDRKLREWALELNAKWKALCRKASFFKLLILANCR